MLTKLLANLLQLDDAISSDCGGRNVSYVGLKDGYHSLQVCANALQGVGCATYNWTTGKHYLLPPPSLIVCYIAFVKLKQIYVNI